jgi:pyrroloquinoline quinone biosynthesis protein B
VKAIVLGSAAGGGYPQWNCCCAICALFWKGDPRVTRRTQSSLAVSADCSSWILLNCSPDIREQIGQVAALQPKSPPRHSPISAVVLTNGDIDHIGGLLSLRESHRFSLWASERVLHQIDSNPAFAVLNRDLVSFRTMAFGKRFSPAAGIEIEAFEVPGKVPLYRESEAGHAVSRDGNTVGLHVRNGGKTLSYVPGCGDIDKQVVSDLASTDALFFDGTLYDDNEMIASGTGQKTGRRMGHVPVSGEDGSIAQLALTGAPARYFVHMNNTNPLLIEGSPQRLMAETKGWTISHDGMEIEL